MKKILLTLSILVMGTVAHAQTISAEAYIVSDISITGETDIDFGQVLREDLASIAYNTASAGAFSIAGTPAALVDFTLSVEDLITDDGSEADEILTTTWTAGFNNDDADVDDATASVAFETSTTTEQSELLNVAGDLWVFVGGSFTPSATQVEGTYTATITLTASYN